MTSTGIANRLNKGTASPPANLLRDARKNENMRLCGIRPFIKQFAKGCIAHQDEWAYVDALNVRQEMNSPGLFSGDVAMRSIYNWK